MAQPPGSATETSAGAGRLVQAPAAARPAHIHAALTGGMAGWQITLIAGEATVLAVVLAVIIRKTHTGRRRATATTAEAMTTSGATPGGYPGAARPPAEPSPRGGH
jgi:hypothetical protein